MRDAGATAVEEMAYTLANGLAYLDELKARDGDIARLAQSLSFFFYVHMDVFEEASKFRAARRIWANLLRERYGIEDEKGQRFRFGVVCGGSSLTAGQPYNNIVRVGLENFAAVLGGAQSIFTCAYDEAFQIPTEFSAEIALRTQQIVAYESGAARTVDPLGGSYYVEWLTDQMEAGILKVMDEIDVYGGVIKAIEDGYLQIRVADRARERKQMTDDGERVVVGENFFTRDGQTNDYGEVFKLNPDGARCIVEKYEALLERRNDAEVKWCLDRFERAAEDAGENVMPCLVDCCHAYATVGEMVARLKRQWGEFQEPVRF